MPASDLAARYDIKQTVDYIINGGYHSVALQFPDDLLPDSPAVSELLQQRLGGQARVFILADTAYNPLGVDEVAAQHLSAQCVIHYGRASLAPVSSLPAFFVFPKDALDVAATVAAVRQAVAAAMQASHASAASSSSSRSPTSSSSSGLSAVVVLLDQGYHRRLEELRLALQRRGGGAEGEGIREGSCGGGAESDGNIVQGGEAAAGSRSGSESGSESGSAATCYGQPPWIFASLAARSLSPKCQQQQQQRRSSSASQPDSAATSGGSCAAAAAVAAWEGTPAACDAAVAPALTGGVGGDGESGGGGGRDCTAAEGCTAGSGCGSGFESSCCYGVAAAAVVGDGRAPDAPVASAAAAAVTAAITAAGDEGDGDSRNRCTICSMAGLRWSLPTGVGRRDCLYVWIGPDGSSTHQVLQLTHSTCEWLSYDPAAGGDVRQGLSEDTRRLLRRRNFMVERARSANIVGLLVGTLGSAGFRDVISLLRRLAVAAGKKTYTFLMGKPNPAKLGNFPEVDVFVMISDAQGLILDCRDYLAPLVTPWEAATAFVGGHLDPEDYRMEMRDVMDLEARYLQRQEQQRKQEQHQDQGEDPRGSMALQALGGGLNVATRGSACSSLMLCSGGREVAVAARTAAEYLAMKRSFRGLEISAGASPKAAQLAVEGLSGRAAVYTDEGGKES